MTPLLYSLFFPSVTFGLLAAEVFPYALIFSILVRKKYYKNEIYIYSLFLVSILWGILKFQYFSFEIIRSLAAYINPLIIFFTIMFMSDSFVIKIISAFKKTFFFLIILAIIQFSGLLATLNISFLFEFLVPRSAVTELGAGRGVTLLSTEPSRAAIELIFIYLCCRFTCLNQKNHLLFDTIVFIILALVIKSAIGILFFTLFFITTINPARTVPFLLVIFVVTGYLVENSNFRWLVVFAEISRAENLHLLWSSLLNLSGFRFISVYAGYLYGFLNPFGAGIGYWADSSIIALNLTNILPQEISYFASRDHLNWVSLRPTSYASSLSLDTGVVGLLFFLFMLRKYFYLLFNRSIYAISIPFFVYLFVVGSIGNPLPWMALAVVMRKKMDE